MVSPISLPRNCHSKDGQSKEQAELSGFVVDLFLRIKNKILMVELFLAFSTLNRLTALEFLH